MSSRIPSLPLDDGRRDSLTPGCLDRIYTLFERSPKSEISEPKSPKTQQFPKKEPKSPKSPGKSKFSPLKFRTKVKASSSHELSTDSSNYFLYDRLDEDCSKFPQDRENQPQPVKTPQTKLSEENKRLLDRRVSIVQIERMPNESDDEFEMRKKDVKNLTNDSGYSEDTVQIDNETNTDNVDNTDNYYYQVSPPDYDYDNDDNDDNNTNEIIHYRKNIHDPKRNFNGHKNATIRSQARRVYSDFLPSHRYTSIQPSSGYGSTDTDDDDEDVVTRRRSVWTAIRPDLEELINDMDPDTLELNQLVIDADENGEKSILTKNQITSNVFRPRSLYQEKRSRRSTVIGMFSSTRNFHSISEEEENIGDNRYVKVI